MEPQLELKYIPRLSQFVDLFKQTDKNVWNFRCPFCGDSKKDKLKARGYIYFNKDHYSFKCHNCSVTSSIKKLISHLDAQLHQEFCLDSIKKEFKPDEQVVPTFKPKKVLKDRLPIPTVKSLDDSHPCKQYCISRKIPNLSLLYYAEDFAEFANSSISEDYGLKKEPRLVIPFFTKDGKLFAVQGRSLNPKEKLRYITCKVNKDEPLVFGLERLEHKTKYYIVEGPIDSLFLKNCVAVAGSDLLRCDTQEWFKENNAVFVLDNEPRNLDIINIYEKIIDKNYKICIWDKAVRQKDINEMVLSGLNPQKLIDGNIYSGLKAKLVFQNYRVK